MALISNAAEAKFLHSKRRKLMDASFQCDAAGTADIYLREKPDVGKHEAPSIFQKVTMVRIMTSRIHASRNVT
jgi:hypothetical protein